jgi:hypothetical protein
LNHSPRAFKSTKTGDDAHEIAMRIVRPKNPRNARRASRSILLVARRDHSFVPLADRLPESFEQLCFGEFELEFGMTPNELAPTWIFPAPGGLRRPDAICDVKVIERVFDQSKRIERAMERLHDEVAISLVV